MVDCSHEIKRCLLLGRKVMTNLESILKRRDITWPTNVHLVKAIVFPVVMYGCESWIIKKAECRRTDAFELWCWRRLLRVPQIARKSLNSTGNQPCIFTGRTDVEAEAPILWPPDAKSWLIGKDPDAGKDWRHEEKGTTEDEMVRLHHQLNGHEFAQTLRDDEGQGSLVSFGPWGLKESDTTQQLNNTTSCFIRLALYLETAPFILDKQDGLGCSQQGESRVCCTSCRQWAAVLKT